MDNQKHIKEILNYLDRLESFYVTEENKNEKSRMLLTSSINQIKYKLDILSRTLNCIEGAVNFEKDNYIRIGNFIDTLNEFSDEKYYLKFEFTNLENIGFLNGYLCSYGGGEKIKFLNVPHHNLDLQNYKRLSEIEINGKRFSWALNYNIITDEKKAFAEGPYISCCPEFLDLVVNTKWITPIFSEDEIFSKAAYLCIIDDRQKRIDRSNDYYSQYKIDTKSPIVSMKIGDLMIEYKKELRAKFGKNILLTENEVYKNENYGDIHWSFSFPSMHRKFGEVFFTCIEYQYSKGWCYENRFADMKNAMHYHFTFTNPKVYDVFFDGKGLYTEGVGFENLVKGRNSEIVIDINLQDKYLLEKQNMPLLKAVNVCIKNGKLISSKNFDANTNNVLI